MNVFVSVFLLMRGFVLNVGKMIVFFLSEIILEIVILILGVEQDGYGVEIKKVDKFERRDEVESVKKEEDEKVVKDNNGIELSEMKNVLNFLDDVDFLNEKKFLKNEFQVKLKKNYIQKEERKEKLME